jgi:hypothetical protein
MYIYVAYGLCVNQKMLRFHEFVFPVGCLNPLGRIGGSP